MCVGFQLHEFAQKVFRAFVATCLHNSHNLGGIRVNAFVSGGFIPTSMMGTKLNGLVCLWDWYSTFAGLAGQDPNDYAAVAAGLPDIDSINVWDYITGAQVTKLTPHLL